MNGIPEPWGSLLVLLTGPYGVVVAEAVAIFFLWRLFREADKRADLALVSVGELVTAVKDVTRESRTWRKAMNEMLQRHGIRNETIIIPVDEDE